MAELVCLTPGPGLCVLPPASLWGLRFSELNKRTVPALGRQMTSKHCWTPLEISPGEPNRSRSRLLWETKKATCSLENEQRWVFERAVTLSNYLVLSMAEIALHFIIWNSNLLISLTLRMASRAARRRSEVEICAPSRLTLGWV